MTTTGLVQPGNLRDPIYKKIPGRGYRKGDDRGGAYLPHRAGDEISQVQMAKAFFHLSAVTPYSQDTTLAARTQKKMVGTPKFALGGVLSTEGGDERRRAPKNAGRGNLKTVLRRFWNG